MGVMHWSPALGTQTLVMALLSLFNRLKDESTLQTYFNTSLIVPDFPKNCGNCSLARVVIIFFLRTLVSGSGYNSQAS